ncbi:hypothetical protein [Actinopolyspora mzabensis]|uniref:hypothetical protein n=1 Tax=Actinopolyspora mzabensis TaxID=995066 RepID=UPI001C40A24A
MNPALLIGAPRFARNTAPLLGLWPPSNRQEATVSWCATSEAGRCGDEAGGANPVNCSSKSISTPNRSAFAVSSTFAASNGEHRAACCSRNHGENVATSIMPRTGSNKYSRIIPAPP